MLLCLIGGGGGYPIQSWLRRIPPSSPGQGGYLHPILAKGGTPSSPGPRRSTPSSPGWGSTPSSPGQGVPHPVLAGGYPGYPPLDLGRNTASQLDGVPPPPRSRCGLTNKLKTVPSPILRMRAVIILKFVHEKHLLYLLLEWSSGCWWFIVQTDFLVAPSLKSGATYLLTVVYVCRYVGR